MVIWVVLFAFIASWCDKSHNFMDIDNPNAKKDLQHYVSDWLPKINTDDLVPDSLSWTRNDARWYANKYYEDTLQEYVDVAKQWLSWAIQDVKWYYNSWIDELNKMVSDKVNSTISGELNKFKIK
jgi:hypothetical protein